MSTKMVRAAIAAVVMSLCGCAGLPPTTTLATTTGAELVMPPDRVTGPFTVTEVVDGDTIWISRDGEPVKVRLIGIDTPEAKDPRTGVQCFGIEASEYLGQQLSGEQVLLEHDTSQDGTDRYGRELAYVWSGSGNLVNLAIIGEGYGHEYTYDVPYRYQRQFRAAQADAQAHDRGLWSPSACNGDTSSN